MCVITFSVLLFVRVSPFVQRWGEVLLGADRVEDAARWLWDQSERLSAEAKRMSGGVQLVCWRLALGAGYMSSSGAVGARLRLLDSQVRLWLAQELRAGELGSQALDELDPGGGRAAGWTRRAPRAPPRKPSGTRLRCMCAAACLCCSPTCSRSWSGCTQGAATCGGC